MKFIIKPTSLIKNLNTEITTESYKYREYSL